MNTAITLSRRGLLSGLLASSCLTMLPNLARSEPMTALAAGAAVVGIISGVSGMFSDSRREKVLGEISRKLNVIIRNQAIILAEIQSLKLYIDESLYRSFRENTIIRMNAHLDRYEILITELPTGRSRDEYLDLQSSVMQTTFELGQFDTPAYIAFGAGVGMTLAIHQALGLREERFKKLKEVFKRSYDHWLNPDNPKSIVTIVAATESEIARRTAALNARPRTVQYTGRKGLCTYITTVTISGDLEHGFTGRATTSHVCDDPCVRNPRMCPTGLGNELEQTEKEVANRLLGMLSMAAPTDVRQVTVPQFVPSGFAVVDEMNKERIAIFELMELLARQQVIQEQMEKCRDALAA